jgi:hypothetical protein
MDDWDDDDWIIWFGVGSAEPLQEVETPRFRSVSPAAHRCFQIDRDRAEHRARMSGRAPIGFHRPVR